MRITPVEPVIMRPNPPKYRAFPSIHNGNHPEPYKVIDTVTREIFPCDSEAEMWEKVEEINRKGILV